MPVPERSHELIQKYLDALISDSELAELEQLLATDPQVAHAFAEMARLHANLQEFFRKQYKMDQVAALLNTPEPSKLLPVSQPSGEPGTSIEAPSPPLSTFTPRYAGSLESQRGDVARKLHAVISSRKTIAVAIVLLMAGAAVWFAKRPAEERPRLISGRVTVAGREVAEIPKNGEFEVTGHDAAVIELPGGAQIELVAATRAAIRREKDQFVIDLASGGGDFRVQPDQPSFRVETRLGTVTTNAGQFSVDLVTTLPAQVSTTVTIQLPRLLVVVAQGSVTVEHAGVSTILAAGEEQIFLNPISS